MDSKKANKWVLNKAGIKRELLDTVKAKKLAYYGHNIKKQGSCMEKEIMQGTMPSARRRGRPHTTWMDNINTCTGLPVEESVRMTEDRDKLRKDVHGVANCRIEDGQRTQQNISTHYEYIYKNSSGDEIANVRFLTTISHTR